MRFVKVVAVTAAVPVMVVAGVLAVAYYNSLLPGTDKDH